MYTTNEGAFSSQLNRCRQVRKKEIVEPCRSMATQTRLPLQGTMQRRHTYYLSVYCVRCFKEFGR